ncbi:uncharacterized protein LOC143450773 [Clavelina lepadiformis]|uniref:uncharacterized protein LOC143450773 n=1 Tax=Clavelina lepadiformis TaxID=159417 RepID=UPI0040436A75
MVINQLTDWKFPLCSMDIRLLVQTHLNGKGKKTQFVDNLPGPDWMNLFQSRHNLTGRISDNVKPSRAEISHDQINRYFDNLFNVIDGIEPQNIWNYDETNVTDNPGAKMCIVPRGLRRVERKIASSKQAISVMFCGNAAGQFLPPMTVYKSKNLYAEWTRNGPQNAVYDHSVSGWFDASLFEKCFFGLFLEAVKDTPGTKIMLGDNLASHFSETVLKACEENDIKFVSLLPNATHLLQPLDVSVFGPGKRMWRRILAEWRKESRSKNSIPKNIFPMLLKRFCDGLNEKQQNLVAGFKACGIFPKDREQVLKRLPPANSQPVQEVLGNAVATMLEEYISPRQTATRKRGPKITPGAAISSCDISSRSDARKRKRAAAEPNDSSEDEGEVCVICNLLDPPRGRSRDVDWEGCDNCDLWYHKICLRDNGGLSASDYCSCA